MKGFLSLIIISLILSSSMFHHLKQMLYSNFLWSFATNTRDALVVWHIQSMETQFQCMLGTVLGQEGLDHIWMVARGGGIFNGYSIKTTRFSFLLLWWELVLREKKEGVKSICWSSYFVENEMNIQSHYNASHLALTEQIRKLLSSSLLWCQPLQCQCRWRCFVLNLHLHGVISAQNR